MIDQPDPPSTDEIDEASLSERHILPLLQEELSVGKRTITTGTVRLQKQVVESVEHIDLPLEAVTWQVDRVPMGVVVAERPATRHEGETVIYPIVEERIVVTRELVLREEVRVTRVVTATRHRQDFILRHEELDIQRDGTPQT